MDRRQDRRKGRHGMETGRYRTGETPQYLVTVAVLVIDTATGAASTATAQRRTYGTEAFPLSDAVAFAASEASAVALGEVESA